jgi:2,4-dienoyl-CoA reductase [(3E)-enoyl-CoA-producing], peroxisomal
MSQLSSNAFKSVIDIDVLGTYNTMKAALPHIVASAKKYKNQSTSNPAGTGGRIISISATFHYTGQQLQTHVVAAKAAVDGLACNVAIEYGPYGVTSNVIAPGPIAGTEGMERLATKSGRTAEAERAIPLNRYGTVKEIADATVYLFSDTGNYVNGEVLVVDGGAWRTSKFGVGFEYPDFILSGNTISGVGGMKKAKL